MGQPKATILCIDDDGAGLEARKELLEISGYDLLTAQSGMQGLELFVSSPDFGERVARQMRRIKPDIPMLTLSGYCEFPPDKLRCFDAFLCGNCSQQSFRHCIGC